MTNFTDIEHHYNNIASIYDNKWQKYNYAQINWIINNWSIDKNYKSVLDIGCGTGNFLFEINKKYPQLNLTGVDLSDNMLRLAQEKLPQANLLHKNIETDDKIEKSDVTISMSILHHINDHDKHLKKLKEHTNEGGEIYLSAFSKDSHAMNLADRLFSKNTNIHSHSLSHDKLTKKINTFFNPIKLTSDILRPDNFWMVQIYKIEI